MRGKRTALIGAGILIATAGLVGGLQSSTYAAKTDAKTVAVNLGDMDRPGTGHFPKFDPSLGKLESVTLTADVTMKFQSCLTNLSLESSTIQAGQVSGDAPITFAGGVIAEAKGSMDVPTTTLSANTGDGSRVDGCGDWLGSGPPPSGPVPTTSDSNYLAKSAPSTWTKTITDPSILKLYEGSGTVAFHWTATTDSTLGQPSEWTIIFLAKGSGTASVVYNYRPARVADPSLTTTAAGPTTLPVSASGNVGSTRLHDTVHVSGFVGGGTAKGTATLYGPTGSAGSSMCTAANRVGSVHFTPRNGAIATPSLSVHQPGYYTWVASTSADRFNHAASHGCGVGAETVLVHRPPVPALVIDTGYDGVEPRGRLGTTLHYPALGITAPVVPVGARNGRLQVPSDTHHVGWFNRSAGLNELIGTSLIAGHVSNDHDVPGAFYKLRNASIGQVVTVGSHKYKVTRKYAQARTKRLPAWVFTTTGHHKVALVTCTAKIVHPDGRFHYTKNLVVLATQIS